MCFSWDVLLKFRLLTHSQKQSWKEEKEKGERGGERERERERILLVRGISLVSARLTLWRGCINSRNFLAGKGLSKATGLRKAASHPKERKQSAYRSPAWRCRPRQRCSCRDFAHSPRRTAPLLTPAQWVSWVSSLDFQPHWGTIEKITHSELFYTTSIQNTCH